MTAFFENEWQNERKGTNCRGNQNNARIGRQRYVQTQNDIKMCQPLHSHIREIGRRKAVPSWKAHISWQEVSERFLQVWVGPEIHYTPKICKCLVRIYPIHDNFTSKFETVLGMKAMPLFQLSPSRPSSSACPSRPTSCETSLDAMVRHSYRFVRKWVM